MYKAKLAAFFILTTVGAFALASIVKHRLPGLWTMFMAILDWI